MQCLDRAVFVAIDLEFCGLGRMYQAASADRYCTDSKQHTVTLQHTRQVTNSHHCNTPLPPPTAAEQREYARLRDVARRFGVLQVGVSCFEAPTSGAVAAADFSASTFNFTVFPGFGAQAFEPQSLQFVGRHGFDFNKYVNEGVPYVKPSAPRPVTRRGANDGCMIRTPRAQQAGAGRGGRDNGASVGSTAAARRFGNGVGGEMDFTDVMACVQASGCPIVGHNASFDLAYAMEHFVHPVPNSVSDFAKALLQAFGTVYDTKVITKNRGTSTIQCVRSLARPCDSRHMMPGSLPLPMHGTASVALPAGDEETHLASLFAQISGFAPNELHAPGFLRYCAGDSASLAEEFSHEAGFDAFMTGCIFLESMYMLHHVQHNDPPTVQQLLDAVAGHRNRGNSNARTPRPQPVGAGSAIFTIFFGMCACV